MLDQIGVNPFSTRKELDYMFAERNIHEYKKQILSMNKVEELDDSKDGQKDEYE